MKNIDNLKSLSDKELAWFLMAYSDSCRTCIYKRFFSGEDGHGKFLHPYSCKDIPEETKLPCVNATLAWLNRETEDEDDVFMFEASRNNVKVAERNAEIERHNKEIAEKMEWQEEIERLRGD